MRNILPRLYLKFHKPGLHLSPHGFPLQKGPEREGEAREVQVDAVPEARFLCRTAFLLFTPLPLLHGARTHGGGSCRLAPVVLGLEWTTSRLKTVLARALLAAFQWLYEFWRADLPESVLRQRLSSCATASCWSRQTSHVLL